MDIEALCAAIQSSLPLLKCARVGTTIDHSLVEAFQRSITDSLNTASNGYDWEMEKTAKGRLEKDSIDILGQPSTTLTIKTATSTSIINPKWIIEIDATRSDQVSQKLLSRLALWGLNEPIQYVAILYPDTQNGKNACEKYLRYGNAVLRKINNQSSVVGIFVNPSTNRIEVLLFNESNHFDVNGKECKSMSEAAAEAVRVYLKKRRVTFAVLKHYWGKYVLDQKGPSRFKCINVNTSDGVPVHTFTQFRQYGLSSYWTDFERLCKKRGITITKMRKVYTVSPSFTYIV